MSNLNGNLKDKGFNYPLLLTIAGCLLFLGFPVFTSPDFNWNFRFVQLITNCAIVSLFTMEIKENGPLGWAIFTYLK